MNGQSAVEYLTTYAWAILLITLIIGIVVGLGLLTPGKGASDSCALPSPFNCIGISMSVSGLLTVNIQQATLDTLNMTAIACSDKPSGTGISYTSFTPQISLGPDANTTFSGNCYANGAVFGGPAGTLYKGYLIINYTDTATGVPQQISGTIIARATRG